MGHPDLAAAEGKSSQRPLIMKYAARSDVGRVRAKNDDSAYAGRHLAVVADGMGGHAGGDVASAATVLDMLHLDRESYNGDAATVLADEIQTANSLLSELVHINPKLAGMGTTVTALLLAEGKLHFAHIGDSRAYRLRDGIYEQVSIDHTFVQRLIDEGRLQPEEAETHPHKNVLMRVLGDVDASPELDLQALDVVPGERWLLCSDGLNYVAGHAVERTVRETRNLGECADILIDLTLEAGSPDNVSVVLIDIIEETPDDVNTAAVDIISAPPAATPAASATPMAPGSPNHKPVSASGEPADSTDPHLGEHLSAEVLREELALRPHELVGAAATAAASGSIPTIAGRTVARRAATVLTHKADDTEPAEPEDVIPLKPRRWLTLSIAAAVVVALTAGIWLGYAWTQTRYYVGEYDSRVAIYNGVSQRLGPFQLSTLETVTDLTLDSLPQFTQERVRQTVPAGDLYDAQGIVRNLRDFGTTAPDTECIPPSASPSSSASATGGASPATPTPTASASVGAATSSASPRPTQIACEGTP